VNASACSDFLCTLAAPSSLGWAALGASAADAAFAVLCCDAGGLQRISGSENYGGRMGSLGPWTPPNLASMSDMGAGANLALQPLMSLNNLLKLGRCTQAPARALYCAAKFWVRSNVVSLLREAQQGITCSSSVC
jgi:hypothetical protein